jgi:hypothetical protein
VCSILYDWFGNSVSNAKNTGISFTQEYFKYFAGYYRRTEISLDVCIELLNHTDADFIADFLEIMHTQKYSSFLHKWRIYLENNNSVKRDDMLHKIIIAMVIYSDQEFNTSNQIGYDYENNRAKSFDNIIYFLYTKREGDDLSKVQIELSNILLSNPHYKTDILILETIIRCVADNSGTMVFGANSGDFFTSLKKRLIQKFFDNLKRFPDGTPDTEQIENLKAIRTLMVVDKYDIEQFDLYLKETKFPEDWLYRLVKPYKRGFGWNYNFIKAVTSSYYNNEEILLYIDKLPQSADIYLNDLDVIRSYLKNRNVIVNRKRLIKPTL